MDTVRIGIDGAEKTVPKGTPTGELLPKKSKALAVRFNDALIDLDAPLTTDGTLFPITPEDPEAIEILRHSTSHIMAEAVKALFPEAKVTIGPAIENGFYYDFDYKEGFKPEDLPKIEKQMARIVKGNNKFVRSVVTRAEAVELFEKMGENYKVELINDLPPEVETVSLYKQGNFVDLCRGPHIPHSGRVPAFKLLSLAGAYWRGDEKRPMLQRIYGTAFFSKEDLDQYINFLEEARKRDHRRLGRDLDLFSIQDEAGPGLVIWHPKGALLRTLLENFEKFEHLRRGYQLVMGPQILKTELWERSGHYDNYRENMYFTEVDNISYGIKPMNCLAHMLIYKNDIRSYRDLPFRFFETGTVHRHEKSGVLHGLTRVRQFTQDDAHLICRPDQANEEIKGIIDLVADLMGAFGFEYRLELSTRPEKSIGSDEDWETATEALRRALDEKGLAYQVNEGDGAFYGPKIDVHLKDAIGRGWQCSTIQCDFTMPERFDLTYVGEDGRKHRPVMLHRTIFGSIERFIGILIEHFAGAFPVWLSPVQAVVLTVTQRGDEHAVETTRKLRAAGVRVESDLRNEKLGYKIREAQMQKVPYMLVIGDKEVEAGGIAPRTRTGDDLGFMSVDDFLERIRPELEPPKFA